MSSILTEGATETLSLTLNLETMKYYFFYKKTSDSKQIVLDIREGITRPRQTKEYKELMSLFNEGHVAEIGFYEFTTNDCSVHYTNNNKTI